MENLIIQSTEETPEINFNTNGTLLIKGVSIPENITLFYTPIVNWLTELQNNLPSSINLIFEIEYINTSSTRVFIDIIKKVASIKTLLLDTKIIWRYVLDDEDNFDLGKDLEYSAKIEFIFEII